MLIKQLWSQHRYRAGGGVDPIPDTPMAPGESPRHGLTPLAHWWGDLIGGLTAAIVALPLALPLALAFAIASGVEPKAGLYTAIVAGSIAVVFGGSPLQITGPTGAMAVILVGIVAKYGLGKVWLAGVIVGLVQVAFGVARLGRLVKFIPYPVTAGFTNGIAVICVALLVVSNPGWVSLRGGTTGDRPTGWGNLGDCCGAIAITPTVNRALASGL